MKTIIITEDFEGYPSGAKRRVFAKGEEPEVSDAFAELVVGKGHAREKPPEEAKSSRKSKE